MRNVLATEPNVGLVGHGIKEAFPDGTTRIVAPEKNERLQLVSLAASKVFRLRKSYLGTSRMTLRAELAREILPIPAVLVIEADEYLFTLAAAMTEIVILEEALTYYCIHGSNLYLFPGDGENGLRRKQKVMEALASSFRTILPTKGIPPDVIECIVEIVQAEADKIRLMTEGGSPLETVCTENKLYDVLHADASRRHRLFRALTMLPAVVLPPRRYYAIRSWLASRAGYRRVREKTVPVPKITRVAGSEDFKA